MFKVIMIGLGGFLGAIMRQLSSTYINSIAKTFHFPSGTFFVNMVGCFFIGFLSQLFFNRKIFSSEIESLILIGFLGSFTTYSTFSKDSFKLIHNGETIIAILNIGLHIILGLFAVLLGIYISNHFSNKKEVE